jgi:hypothetical protein
VSKISKGGVYLLVDVLNGLFEENLVDIDFGPFVDNFRNDFSRFFFFHFL